MNAKCSKCGEENFSIKKRDDQLYCYIICSNCGTVAGVLEDIDFKKHHDKVIQNHVFFEKRIKELEEQIKKIDSRDQEIFDMIDWLSTKIKK